MQPNSIVLDVNTDGDDGTTATVPITFTRFDEYQNRSEYIAEDHTLASRNKLGMYRTFPKPNGNFRGMAKSAIKLTKDHAVPGIDATTTVVAPSIVDIGFSFPVGVTDESVVLELETAAALLHDTAVMYALTRTLMI